MFAVRSTHLYVGSLPSGRLTLVFLGLWLWGAPILFIHIIREENMTLGQLLPTRGDFTPQGTSGNVLRNFELSRLNGILRSGMLLNILQAAPKHKKQSKTKYQQCQGWEPLALDNYTKTISTIFVHTFWDLICARHCVKPLSQTISFDPYNPTRWELLVTLCWKLNQHTQEHVASQ